MKGVRAWIHGGCQGRVVAVAGAAAILVLGSGVVPGGVGGLAVADPGAPTESQDREARLPQEEAGRVSAAIHKGVVNRTYSISVTAEPEGVVLRGQVDTDDTRREVCKAAQAATPRRVVDQMTLRPPPPDRDVQAALVAALERGYPASMQRLQVEVSNGVARFTGDLSSHREVDQVLAAAVMVPGVRDVDSAVTVQGRAYPLEEGTRAP